MSKIFISYSSEDTDSVRDFRNKLIKKCSLSESDVFMSKYSIDSGEDFALEISQNIEESDVFLLALTESSQSSAWVKKELKMAIDIHGKRMKNNDGLDMLIVPFFLYKEFPLNEQFRLLLIDIQIENVKGRGNLVNSIASRIMPFIESQDKIRAIEKQKQIEEEQRLRQESEQRKKEEQERKEKALAEQKRKEEEQRKYEEKKKREELIEEFRKKRKKKNKYNQGKTIVQKRIIIEKPAFISIVLIAVVFFVLIVSIIINSTSSAHDVKSNSTTQNATSSEGNNENYSNNPSNYSTAEFTQNGDARFIPWESSGLENHVMEWNDAALEDYMRQLTGIKSGDITLKDVWNFTSINIKEFDVKNAAALGELKNICYLLIQKSDYSGDLEDLTFVKNLDNLDTLVFVGQGIDNDEYNTLISCLKNKPYLTQLSITGNKITDITETNNLPNLSLFYAEDNQIRDGAVISRLENLQDLRISIVESKDLNFLSTLPLKNLALTNSRISSLEGLEKLQSLETLSFKNVEIGDISDFEIITDSPITKLSLSECGLSSIDFVSGLSHLEELDISSNNITDITSLENMVYLTKLVCANNSIGDLSPLKKMINMETLDVTGNPISDLSPLKDMDRLNLLYCSHAELEDISTLSHNKSLESLALSFNQIRDVSALSSLTYLRTLWLADNQIEDITPITKLEHLETLNIQGNNINDVSSLEKMNIKNMAY